MRILVTGFAPFAGGTWNPSWEAVRLLPDRIAGAELVKRELPVVFGAAGEALTGAIEQERPERVLCVGLAGGRTGLAVERVALNLRDASVPDNAGNQPVDVPVFPDGPAAYFATLPVKAMVREICAAGVSAALSYTAGTYVCNDALYTLLYRAEHSYPSLRGGFLHVPYAAEQEEAQRYPSLPLAELVRGLTAALTAIACDEENCRESMGTLF